MKKYLILLFSLSGFLLSRFAHTDDLREVMILGAKLSSKVEAGEVESLKNLNNFAELSQYLNHNTCKGYTYKKYIVEHEDKEFAYIIGSKKYNLVLGIHFKAEIIDNSIDMSSIKQSTIVCRDIGDINFNTTGYLVSHDHPLPNEYHVLQSNMRKLHILVSNPDDVVYSVNGNRIFKVN